MQLRTGEKQNKNKFSIKIKRKAFLQLPLTVRKIFAYTAGNSSTAKETTVFTKTRCIGKH